MPVVSAAEIVSGPRGRRLCLETVLAADETLGAAVFDASRAFLPTDGSVVTFGDTAALAASPLAPVVLADAIRAVSDVALDDVIASEQALLGCLVATVDAAAYWQAPDHVDQLAYTPAVRAALSRMAERLAAAGVLERWSSAAAGAQWRVEFATESSDAAWPGDAPRALAKWRQRAACMEVQYAGVRPEAGVQLTGIWWSRPLEVAATTGDWAGIPCGLGLVEDGQGWESALVTGARGTGHLLELDAATWADLCRRHPFEVTASSGSDWARATGRQGRWVIPDWAAVAEEWDAVHLPIAPYLALAGRVIDVGDGAASVIAGWDPDCTVWLTGAVRAGGEPAAWVCDDASSSAARWRASAG